MVYRERVGDLMCNGRCKVGRPCFELESEKYLALYMAIKDMCIKKLA